MTQDIDGMFPWHAGWWLAHKNMPPTLILRCGIDNCGNRVGEVKSDEDVAVALLLNRFGDRTVPYTPRITESDLGFAPGTVLRDARTGESLAERQSRKFDELDAETIRYVDNGRRVAKRYNARPTAMPLEAIGHIVCPRHGIRDLPDPDATLAGLRRRLTEAEHASKREYVVFP